MIISNANILNAKVRELPGNPGVYLMKDSSGEIIYVGKAVNLKNRVSSYFNRGNLSPKTQKMVQLVHDIDYYITASEEEALVLELNLIKRHRPYYNIRLKDDKGFPYIKIDLNEDWPRVQIVRRLNDDGARYFGPFSSTYSIKQALDVARHIFPFRNCDIKLSGQSMRPCLEYDMRHCVAPCAGYVSRQDYRDVIDGVVLFLEGRQTDLLRQLTLQMRQASESRHFEQAARLRDQIKAVNRVIIWQKAATKVRGDQDVIAFAQDGDIACVQVYIIRNNRLIGREQFILRGTNAEPSSRIMSDFVEQYYAVASTIPSLILLQCPVLDKPVIQRWLSAKHGMPVHLIVPIRGLRKELMDTVAQNAASGLEQIKLENLASSLNINKAMLELKDKLGLPKIPDRIEGYDISNIQGKMAVGSMVVFIQGKSQPVFYRRFRIKTVHQPDDYAMLQEVLRRRFAHIERDETGWSQLPSLVLIDGGRGQLSAACDVINNILSINIPVIGLAKENEEIFLPRLPNPLVLPANSPGLQLLQRVRDEAHRFAIGYHYKIRQRETFTSLLDGIPGVGPKRKSALLKQFGSVDRIKQSSVEILATVPGITFKIAQRILASI